MGKLKDNIYSLKREIAKRIITGNLGTVTENEKSLLCYVKKVPKRKVLKCHGLEEHPYLAKKYQFNKPICYILLSTRFYEKECVIEGGQDVQFIIKNCRFDNGLTIDQCDLLFLKYAELGKKFKVNAKTVSLAEVTSSTYTSPTLDISIKADDVTIEKSRFQEKKDGLEKVKIYINALNKLKLKRAQLGRQRSDDPVEIYTNELEVNHSSFATPVSDEPQALRQHNYTYISAKKMTYNGKTSNIGNMLVEIPVININGTIYTFNGEINESTFSEDNSIYPEVNLKRIIDPVSVKKLQLIELLKKLQRKVSDNNSNERKKFEEELLAKPIKRILKNEDLSK